MARMNLQIISHLARADLKQIKEYDFQVAVTKFAESAGWMPMYFRRTASKGKHGYVAIAPPGWPDLFLVRDEDCVAAELKSETGSTTPDQRKWLSALAGVQDGAISTYIWKPRDAAEAMERLR